MGARRAKRADSPVAFTWLSRCRKAGVRKPEVEEARIRRRVRGPEGRFGRSSAYISGRICTGTGRLGGLRRSLRARIGFVLQNSLARRFLGRFRPPVWRRKSHKCARPGGGGVPSESDGRCAGRRSGRGRSRSGGGRVLRRSGLPEGRLRDRRSGGGARRRG